MARHVGVGWSFARFGRIGSVALLLVAVVAALWAPQLARAAEFSAGDAVVTTTDVNVRSSSGLDASVRFVAEEGTSFTIRDVTPRDEDGYTWYAVRTQSVANAGWVAGDFLMLEGPFNAGQCVVVVDGELNLREDAGVGADIVQVLADGAGLTIREGGPVSADGYLWYPVSTGDRTGWAASAFLAIRNCGSTDEPVPGVGIEIGSSVRVVDGPVNGRDEPGLDSTVIESLATGTVGWVVDGPIIQDGYTWFQVRNFGGWRWVAGELLVEDPDIVFCEGQGPCEDFDTGDEFVVVTDLLNLRSSAGTDGRVIDTLPYGTVGTIRNGEVVEEDDIVWISVRVPNVGNGWVAIGYIAEA